MNLETKGKLDSLNRQPIKYISLGSWHYKKRRKMFITSICIRKGLRNFIDFRRVLVVAPRFACIILNYFRIFTYIIHVPWQLNAWLFFRHIWIWWGLQSGKSLKKALIRFTSDLSKLSKIWVIILMTRLRQFWLGWTMCYYG
jgi:hypothetical protein